MTASLQRPWVVVALGLLVALSVGLALGRGNDGSVTAAAPTLDATAVALSTPTPHLVVVMMENKDYGEVVGSSAAPYINGTVIPSGTSWTSYFAALKPSLPNYLVLTSGAFGTCTTDTCPVGSVAGGNLFTELEGAGVTWKVYAEDMPSACFGSNRKGYVVRHNPAVYYSALGPSGSNTCASNDLPLTALPTDLANGTLPDFSFVVPNQYNDMHTVSPTAVCGSTKTAPVLVCQGDRWLQQWVPQILSHGGRNDVTLVLAFDEGGGNVGGGGHPPLVVVGPTTCAGCTVSTPVTGYGLANAFLTWFGLAPHTPQPVGLTGP